MLETQKRTGVGLLLVVLLVSVAGCAPLMDALNGPAAVSGATPALMDPVDTALGMATGGVAMIPGIGGPLAALIMWYRSRRRTQRSRELTKDAVKSSGSTTVNVYLDKTLGSKADVKRECVSL